MTTESTSTASTAPATPERSVVRGLVLMTIGMLIIPGIDAFAKLLSETMAAGQISWSRFLFQTALLAPIVLVFRRRPQPVRTMTRHWKLHAARGALIAGATLFFFSSLKFLPIADAIAVFFVEPLILTIISAVFLGETIGWRRISAVLVGFAGAVVIIGPGYGVFGPASILPLGAAFCFASYLALTRRLAQEVDAFSMQLAAGISAFLIMGAALIVGHFAGIEVLTPKWPTAIEWAFLAGLGVVGTLGHLLVTTAFAHAPAGVLAPIQYVEIVSATILGYLIFGDFPGLATWLGLVLVIGSGVYVFHRERQLARWQKGPGRGRVGPEHP